MKTFFVFWFYCCVVKICERFIARAHTQESAECVFHVSQSFFFFFFFLLKPKEQHALTILGLNRKSSIFVIIRNSA